MCVPWSAAAASVLDCKTNKAHFIYQYASYCCCSVTVVWLPYRANRQFSNEFTHTLSFTQIFLLSLYVCLSSLLCPSLFVCTHIIAEKCWGWCLLAKKQLTTQYNIVLITRHSVYKISLKFSFFLTKSMSCQQA